MKLVIVESPSKAKTIGKYLGPDFTVVASVGHVRDLPKSNKKAIDIPAGFVPHYEVSRGKERVLAEIKRLANKASEVILATDPDREGEAIAWHIADAAKLKNPDRVVFHEITKDAILRAMKSPRKIDMQLKEAQEARRVLDRLVGYDLSGLIWKKVRYGLSAGRVQSPALRILMEREREIRAFVPETFFVLSANLETENSKEAFFAICEEEPKTSADAEKIVDLAKAGSWLVKDVIETKVKRSPYPPFTTSTLQQAASTRLGFSPKRTMMVAQKLYEAGQITYMRTDSVAMGGEAVAQIETVVVKKFGAENYLRRVFKVKSKNAQEAHEAIRPTSFTKESAGSSDDQKRLYKLIWQRAVSSQMTDALLMRTKIITNIDDGGIPNFSANGSRVLSDGWLLADPTAKRDDVILPKVDATDLLNLLNLDTEEKQTQPPKRYSEAGLIKELERRGIGRPSTYASIINTIIERGYVDKEGRTLMPTDTGDVVSSFLEENFENYISDTFTAEMEDELDEIAEGKRKYEPTLREFYEPFSREVKEKEKTAKLTNLGEADPSLKCSDCEAGMIIKLGRGGKFLSCERFPDCKGMRNIDGSEIKAAEAIGIYPETGEEIFVLTGRFGPYLQVGEKTDKNKKPRRASIPKEQNLDEITLEAALKYLSLPRELGPHPDSGKMISANVGRFGPYVVHDGDFRSIKGKDGDNVYAITLARALEIFSQPKKVGRRGRKKKTE
ncbi:MAG: type I DNA topoisomerase [Candidatus Harrisonbacteria bacterium CG10_big_fil_rev_8_21_14_0_10_45_28]|uniref:DNA topoisomerase 1 n=1 Tax=Candidatus Harrisonbacteria bacterium CG10_big_fil_rev_8_21_14_0_10_45_28 TaxID=1974586 RepID=A0A2H0UPA0_9BACT|nr:MAG: type I DNA topoisomerase [Candidatus Harrisonbacteria bacterium CG10_big_fil_rev_8_21_14_0_10_45_28]